MNKQGYKVMSIKGDVIEEIRKRAKEEDKTLSVFLSGILKQVYSNREGESYSNSIATEIKGLTEDLKKAVYSKDIATGDQVQEDRLREILKEELLRSVKGLESDMSELIRAAVLDAVQDLKR